MKQETDVRKTVENSKNVLVRKGMPKDGQCEIEKLGLDRYDLAITFNQYLGKRKNYLACVLDLRKNLVDCVRADLRGGLEIFSQDALLVLANAGKDLECKDMQTYIEEISNHGPWSEVLNKEGKGTGVYRINIDLFLEFE